MCSGVTPAVIPAATASATPKAGGAATSLEAQRAVWIKLAERGGLMGSIARNKLASLGPLTPPASSPGATLGPRIETPKTGAADLRIPQIVVPK